MHMIRYSGCKIFRGTCTSYYSLFPFDVSVMYCWLYSKACSLIDFINNRNFRLVETELGIVLCGRI
jgi:hypothetical protein